MWIYWGCKICCKNSFEDVNRDVLDLVQQVRRAVLSQGETLPQLEQCRGLIKDTTIQYKVLKPFQALLGCNIVYILDTALRYCHCDRVL